MFADVFRSFLWSLCECQCQAGQCSIDRLSARESALAVDLTFDGLQIQLEPILKSECQSPQRMLRIAHARLQCRQSRSVPIDIPQREPQRTIGRLVSGSHASEPFRFQGGSMIKVS